MPEQYPEFVDYTSAPPGTPLVAATTDALLVAQSCLLTGGFPTTNGTLSLTQPATTVILNTGTQVIYLAAVSQGITFPASYDNYVDMTSSGYVIASVSNGSGAPALTSGGMRLYKAVSGASAVTSITQLIPNAATPQSATTPVAATAVAAPDETLSNAAVYGNQANYPPSPTDTLQHTVWRWLYRIYYGLSGIAQTLIAYDSTEAASSSGSSSLVSNLNHIRQAIANLVGGTFASAVSNTKAAILSDGSNAGATVTLSGIPVTMAGVALGGGHTITDWKTFTFAWNLAYSASLPYQAPVLLEIPGAAVGDTVLVSYQPLGTASWGSMYYGQAVWQAGDAPITTAAYGAVVAPNTVWCRVVCFNFAFGNGTTDAGFQGNGTVSLPNSGGTLTVELVKHT